MNLLLPSNLVFGLKILALVLMFCGIIVTLLENLGFFSDKQKIEFYKKLSTDLRCNPNEPGAEKFLDDFFYTKDMADFELAKTIKEIGIVGTYTKSGDTKSLIGGYAVVRSTDGEHTVKLATIEEIRHWAYSTKTAQWVGWVLVVIGFICSLVLFFLDKPSPD